MQMIPSKEIFRRLQHTAVYVIGPPEKRPVKIGIATDIYKRVGELQVAHWKELRVHWLAWTAAYLVARRVETECHKILQANRVRGEWFDIDPVLAKETIFLSAKRMDIRLFSHEWMVQKCQFLAEKKERDECRSLIFSGRLPGGC